MAEVTPAKRARKRPAQPRPKRQRNSSNTSRMSMLSSVLMARNAGATAAEESEQQPQQQQQPHRQSIELSLKQQIEDEERVEITYIGSEVDKPPPLPMPDPAQLNEQEKRRRAALALISEDRRFSTWIPPCLELGLANTCAQIGIVHEHVDEACDNVQQLYQSLMTDKYANYGEEDRDAKLRQCKNVRMRMRKIAEALTEINSQLEHITTTQRSLMLSHDTMMRNMLCHANRVGTFNPERPGGKLISNPYMWK